MNANCIPTRGNLHRVALRFQRVSSFVHPDWRIEQRREYSVILGLHALPLNRMLLLILTAASVN